MPTNWTLRMGVYSILEISQEMVLFSVSGVESVKGLRQSNPVVLSFRACQPSILETGVVLVKGQERTSKMDPRLGTPV